MPYKVKGWWSRRRQRLHYFMRRIMWPSAASQYCFSPSRTQKQIIFIQLTIVYYSAGESWTQHAEYLSDVSYRGGRQKIHISVHLFFFLWIKEVTLSSWNLSSHTFFNATLSEVLSFFSKWIIQVKINTQFHVKQSIALSLICLIFFLSIAILTRQKAFSVKPSLNKDQSENTNRFYLAF